MQTENVCPNCKETPDWLEDPVRGDYICNVCGLVLDEPFLDEGLEKRNFSDSGVDHNRGNVVDKYFAEKSMKMTTIHSSHTKGTSHTKRNNSKLQSAQKRLNSLSNPTDSRWEQHLDAYFGQIVALGKLLELGELVLGTAKDYIYQYEKAQLGKKRSLKVRPAALAVIHLACAKLQKGRTIKDMIGDLLIARGACRPSFSDEVTEKEVWKARKKIIKQLPGIDVQTSAGDVIFTFCQNLEVGVDVENVARKIQEKIQPLVEGKTPSTIAGGSILLACDALGITVDRGDVAAVSSVAESTLSNFFKSGKKHWPVIASAPEDLAELRLKRAKKTN